MSEAQKSLQDRVVELYRTKVEEKHRELISAWPIISGFNSKIGTYKSWAIVILVHTGTSSVKLNSGFGEVTPAIVGVEEITQENKNLIRARIERHFKVEPHDAVVLLEKQADESWGYQMSSKLPFKSMSSQWELFR